MAFSGHLVIAADLDPAAIIEHFPLGDYLTWCNPANAAWLADKVGGEPNIVDLLLAAHGLGDRDGLVALAADGLSSHPRVVEAATHRHNVEVLTTNGDAGVLVMGTGLAGRRELAFEVAASRRGRGIGRALATAARRRAPDGSLLWAQVAPANAASIRALLAAGFTPVGTEQLIY